MIVAEHTWVPVLPEWVVELQPLLVLAGLLAGVFVLWQMLLTTFQPKKRWAQFRHKDEEEEEYPNDDVETVENPPRRRLGITEDTK